MAILNFLRLKKLSAAPTGRRNDSVVVWADEDDALHVVAEDGTDSEVGGGSTQPFEVSVSSFTPMTLTPPDEVKSFDIPAGTWILQCLIAWKFTGDAASQQTFFYDTATGLTGSEWQGSIEIGQVSTAIITAKAEFSIETEITVMADYEGSAEEIEINFGKLIRWGVPA